jgi:hypothetical protein
MPRSADGLDLQFEVPGRHAGSPVGSQRRCYTDLLRGGTYRAVLLVRGDCSFTGAKLTAYLGVRTAPNYDHS